MTRLHGLCNASHNRMVERAHLEHLSYRPAPQLWTGDKCPPSCFPHSFGLGISAPHPVSEFCLERYSSVVSAVTRLQGILNSIICKPVSVICAPPPPYLLFQQYMKKKRFFKALMAPSGGHVPLRPGSFRPGSFWHGSIRPWVVLAQFGGLFRPILAHLSRSLIGELIVYMKVSVVRPSVRNIFKGHLL